MRQTFEIPLDIPDVTIEHVTTNPLGHIEITVKSTMVGTPCRQCGEMTTQFYGEDREIRLRHLPILGRQTYICLRPKLGRLNRPICLDHFLDLPNSVQNPVLMGHMRGFPGSKNRATNSARKWRF